MEDKFNKILDICLDKVCNKQQSIDSCLQEFHAYKEQLKPLLTAALETQNLFEALLPDTPKKQATYQRIIRTGSESKKVSEPKVIFLKKYQKWVGALAASIIILMTGGLTTASVSAEAIPGDSLYPIKLGTQNLRLFFTPSSLSKGEYHAQLADDKIAELGRLVVERREEFIPLVAANVKEHLTEVRSAYGKAYPLTAQSGEEAHSYKPPNLSQKQKESRNKSYLLLSKGYQDKQKYLRPEIVSEGVVKESEVTASLSWLEREYTLTLSYIGDIRPIRPEEFKRLQDGTKARKSVGPGIEKSAELVDFKGQLVAVSPVTGMMIILDEKGVETVVRVTAESVIYTTGDAKLQNNLSVGDHIQAKVNPRNKHLKRLDKYPKPQSRPVNKRKTR